jgi:hypothetical protein
MLEGMKTCSKCKEKKPLSEFRPEMCRGGRLGSHCKKCHAQYARDWYFKHREEILPRAERYRKEHLEGNRISSKKWQDKNRSTAHARYIKNTYGITVAIYNSMIESQRGVCRICGSVPHAGKRLNIDHAHRTGAIRGLLCHSCNSAIGMLRDDPNIADAAADYLRSFESKKVGEAR